MSPAASVMYFLSQYVDQDLSRRRCSATRDTQCACRARVPCLAAKRASSQLYAPPVPGGTRLWPPWALHSYAHTQLEIIKRNLINYILLITYFPSRCFHTFTVQILWLAKIVENLKWTRYFKIDLICLYVYVSVCLSACVGICTCV